MFCVFLIFGGVMFLLLAGGGEMFGILSIFKGLMFYFEDVEEICPVHSYLFGGIMFGS